MKTFAIVVILIVAMGIAGFSYASWYQSIYIVGDVTTGKVDFQIASLVVHNQTGGSISIDWKTQPTQAWLNITNTYPGWNAFLNLTLYNAGTIPIRLEAFRIQTWGGDSGTMLQYYRVAFCMPTTGFPFNYGPVGLNTITGWQFYDTIFGIPFRPYVTIQPGQYHINTIYLECVNNDNVPLNTNLKAYFELEAAPAT
jgi:hypothetical protein